MKNHFDKNGNYINVENLSLAEIYHRGYQDGSEDGLEGIRPQGEWEHWHSDNFIPEDIWKCSKCKAEFYIIPDTWDYCPICGADMRGEDHD